MRLDPNQLFFRALLRAPNPISHQFARGFIILDILNRRISAQMKLPNSTCLLLDDKVNHLLAYVQS